MKNTGARFGKAVAQLYVGVKGGNAIRPVRELKGFEKVALNPGESREITFTLNKRAFAYWNTEIHDWYAETGTYTIEVGASSRDLPLRAEVQVESSAVLPRRYDLNSIFMDLMADPKARKVLAPFTSGASALFGGEGSKEESEAAAEAISEDMSMAMLNYMPLRGILSFGGGAVQPDLIQSLLDQINGAE